MVGDSIDDMVAGRLSGATTVLLANETNQALITNENTDISITRLDELIDILDSGLIISDDTS